MSEDDQCAEANEKAGNLFAELSREWSDDAVRFVAFQVVEEMGRRRMAAELALLRSVALDAQCEVYRTAAGTCTPE